MAEAGASFIRPDTFWRELGLRAGQTVVHLGCGPGFYLIPAAQIVGTKGRAIGVDIVSTMLQEVEGRAAYAHVTDIVRTIRGNLETPKGSTLPEEVADWVLVANILHQAKPVPVLTEARRLVRPSGSVIVVEWDVVATPLGPPEHKRVTQAEVRAAATEVGLTEQRTFAPSPYHFGIIFTPHQLPGAGSSAG